jgi:hypothetical protein
MNYFFDIDQIGQKLIVRVDDDGTVWWLGEKELDSGYLAWVAEGNTATEWQPEA